jgi:hypothetical protein
MGAGGGEQRGNLVCLLVPGVLGGENGRKVPGIFESKLIPGENVGLLDGRGHWFSCIDLDETDL